MYNVSEDVLSAEYIRNMKQESDKVGKLMLCDGCHKVLHVDCIRVRSGKASCRR